MAAASSRSVQHHQHDILASFSFADLHVFSHETQGRWLRALRGEGALLLSDIPGYSAITATALDEYSSCLQTMRDLVSDPGDAAQGPINSLLPGGAHRSTMATFTNERIQQPLPQWTLANCPRLLKPAAALRGLISLLIELIAQSTDTVMEKVLEKESSPQFGRTSLLEDMVQTGVRIEHFHRYVQTATALEQPALRMHTDAGLLQVLAVHWRAAPHSARSLVTRGGLEVELSDGTVISAEQPTRSGIANAEGAGLLVLVGQGFVEWLPQMQLRAAPHSLALSAAQERMVYGVMVLPPKDWILPGSGTTFGHWWHYAQRALNGSGEILSNATSTVVDMVESPHFGCLSMGELQRRLQDQADACPAGEIYCWMQCAPAAHLSCGSEQAICVSQQKGEICSSGEGHVHDASCRPQCPGTDLFNLEVFGAGEDVAVNGIFKPDETYNQKRSYRKPRKSLRNNSTIPPAWIYWHAKKSQWLLYAEEYKNEEVLYYNDKDSPSPPEDGWQNSRGTPPAPTVRYIRSTASAFSVTYAGEGFCNGLLTDMHMTGFVSRGEEHPCLILLFSGWELTENSKFWGAFFGVIVAGIFAECLIAFRRQIGPPKQVLWNTSASGCARLQPKSVMDRLLRLVLYAVSRALGYFVMLVAMTYSVELFCAVLLGLTLGHALFNIQVSAGEKMTACDQAQANVPADQNQIVVRPKPERPKPEKEQQI